MNKTQETKKRKKKQNNGPDDMDGMFDRLDSEKEDLDNLKNISGAKKSRENLKSRDDSSHDDSSHDDKSKTPSKTTKYSSNQVNSANKSRDDSSHDDKSRDLYVSGDESAPEKRGVNEKVTLPKVTRDESAPEKEKTNNYDFDHQNDSHIPQYIDKYFLLYKAFTDFCLMQDIKHTSRIILQYLLSFGKIDIITEQKKINEDLQISKRVIIQTLKELHKAGYIIKPEKQPYKKTRVLLTPFLEKFLEYNQIDSSEDIINTLIDFWESFPICSIDNDGIKLSYTNDFSGAEKSPERLVMFCRLGINNTYNTRISGAKKSPEISTYKITSNQSIILRYLFIWSFLYNFSAKKLPERKFENIITKIKNSEETGNTDLLTSFEKAMIYTGYQSKVKEVPHPWNYFYKCIEGEHYKDYFTQEKTEEFIRFKKDILSLKNKKATEIKNEILALGEPGVKKYLNEFRFTYYGESNIDMMAASDAITEKIQRINESFEVFKETFRIRTMTHSEEFEEKRRNRRK